MSPAEKLLWELIALPSVNPAFLPPGDPNAGEARVADFLTAFAGASGLGVEQREVFPRRSNVIIRLEPRAKARHRVILAPHMDTVAAASFVPVKKGDRIYGRGACDTKGSIAAMLSAVIAVREARPETTEIILTALVDEEHFQGGSRALVREGVLGDIAIIGEPTCLKMISAHKGDVWLTIETRGRAAHGAVPHLGRNAVHEMARVVEVLQTEYARMLARRGHDVLGAPTVNVGTICGGTQPNIVPDSCAITVDRRTIPGEDAVLVVREIKALLRRHGLRATVSDVKDAAPCWPMETDCTLPFVKSFMGVLRQRAALGVHYFSDASVFARAGTPAVLFGPGDIAQAHRPDEWISLRSFEHATALLVRYLQSLP